LPVSSEADGGAPPLALELPTPVVFQRSRNGHDRTRRGIKNERDVPPRSLKLNIGKSEPGDRIEGVIREPTETSVVLEEPEAFEL